MEMRTIHFDALNIGGHEIEELRYADDTALLSNTASGLGKMILSIKNNSEVQILCLNANKTKKMTTDKTKTDNNESKWQRACKCI